jgi:tripartite-type tricarboxylate transporter receptor subunit TctC
MKKFVFILVMALVTLFSTALRADDYPTRPITLVAVFGPGSASDTICRIIANKLGPALGQPVVVEDRPGADGALAALYVHHQSADGYTLLMATNSPLSADPYLHKDVNYDPVKDFVPITRVGSFTLMLVVNPNLPIHSVKEMIDYAKANPGNLTFATGNTAGMVKRTSAVHSTSRTLFDDAIAVAVWTSFHLCLPVATFASYPPRTSIQLDAGVLDHLSPEGELRKDRAYSTAYR